ncbi:MAG TPA: STAS domain-containing protein [Gammaproteobacteria bacterium]
MTRYRLPEQLDIRHVADVHRQVAALAAAGGGSLDGAAVTRIDTTGVQLLAAALAAGIKLEEPAACVQAAFTSLGLAHLLNSQ